MKDKQSTENGWISVEDGLPEVEDWNQNTVRTQNFNVCVHWLSFDPIFGEPEDSAYVAAAEYDFVQRSWRILDLDFPIVTNALLKKADINHLGYWISHWMPLPKPPRSVKK